MAIRISHLAVAAGLVVLVAGQAQAAPGDAAKGQKAFQQRCALCHAVAAGTPSGMGPNLFQVVGRKPGAAPGYVASPALKSVKGLWNAQTLDGYLASPPKTAPGTRMMINVPSPQDRADLIAYLATLKR